MAETTTPGTADRIPASDVHPTTLPVTSAPNAAVPAQPAPVPTLLDRGVLLFVLVVWALMVYGALYLVWNYGGRIPYDDDWFLAPVLTGHQPVNFIWLWSQINEHRFPLPKLTLFGLYTIFQYDVRSAMYFNVACLAVLSLAMIWGARRLRGRASLADAVFPIALLHWGHCENLLFGFQVFFVLPTFLAGIVLLLIVRQGVIRTFGASLLAGICVVLLPLCGAGGVAFVPALAVWLGYSALVGFRSTEAGRTRNGAVLMAAAVLALLLTGFYFIGLVKPWYHPPSPSWWASLLVATQFLSNAFGLIGAERWPFSGLVVLGLLLVSTAALPLAWYCQAQERGRGVRLALLLVSAQVLLAGLTAGLCMVLGLGTGMPGLPSLPGFPGFAVRFIPLALLLLCGVYALVLLGVAVVFLVRIAIGRQEPVEHYRAAGLFLFVAAVLGLALGLGSGRAGLGADAGFAARYIHWAALGVCAAYFLWTAAGGVAGRVAQVACLAILCGGFLINWKQGHAAAQFYYQRQKGFENDLRAGTPPALLADKYVQSDGSVSIYTGRVLPHVNTVKEELAEFLVMLNKANIGVFRHVQNPELGEVLIPLQPLKDFTHQARWSDDGTIEGLGEDPQVVFALRGPEYVSALRLTYSYEKAAGPGQFQLFWRKSGQEDFEGDKRNASVVLDSSPGEKTVTIAVNDTLDQFRIDPDDKPCVFKIAEIRLLVPTADHARLLEQYRDVPYRITLTQLREAVRQKVPEGATVLVVTRGNDELLQFERRQGWHFLRDKQGGHAGNPSDGKQAIKELEEHKTQGARYLLIPEDSRWWLTHQLYKEFADHLEKSGKRIHDGKHGVLFELSEPKP